MTERLDLPDRYRRQIETLLAEHLPEAEVWAYGSRVKGNSRPASDLDLVVRSPTLEPIPTGRLSDLEEAFEESNIPILIQLYDWASLPTNFHEEIKKQYVILREGQDGQQARTKEWITIRLGDACTKIGSGATPRGGKDTYLREGSYTLIRSQNVHNDRFRHEGLVYIDERQAANLANAGVRSDDVLLNITGDSVARSCQVDPKVIPARVNQHVAILRPDREVLSPLFLRYALVSPSVQAQLLSLAGSGGTRKALTKRAIESLLLRVPQSVHYQEELASVLSVLDDKIELNRQISRTLEATAQALFRLWFVASDRLCVKMKNSDTAFRDHTADLFTDDLGDSSLGEIPRDWRIYSLDEVATFVNGLALQKFPPSDGHSLPIIKIAQLRSGNLQGADLASADLAPSYIVEDGDILFSWSGSLECRIWTSGRGALNQHLFRVIPNGTPKWLCYFAIHQHLNEFREIAAGKMTTMGHIQRQHLRDAKLAIPPEHVLDRMDAMLSPILGRSIAAALEANRLEQLRDVLLPLLVSGQIQPYMEESHQL